MCGRFSLDSEIFFLIKRYKARNSIRDYDPKDEVFPTDLSPIILNRGETELCMMTWGFRFTFTKRPIINARGETVDSKASFKSSFYHKRCIIPVTGFFEWEKTGDRKIKRRITSIDEELFSLAGLYNTFRSSSGKEYLAFTILTTEANEAIRPIHHRMPVILPREKENIWIDMAVKNPNILKELLKPYDRNLLIE